MQVLVQMQVQVKVQVVLPIAGGVYLCSGVPAPVLSPQCGLLHPPNKQHSLTSTLPDTSYGWTLHHCIVKTMKERKDQVYLLKEVLKLF